MSFGNEAPGAALDTATGIIGTCFVSGYFLSGLLRLLELRHVSRPLDHPSGA